MNKSIFFTALKGVALGLFLFSVWPWVRLLAPLMPEWVYLVTGFIAALGTYTLTTLAASGSKNSVHYLCAMGSCSYIYLVSLVGQYNPAALIGVGPILWVTLSALWDKTPKERSITITSVRRTFMVAIIAFLIAIPLAYFWPQWLSGNIWVGGICTLAGLSFTNYARIGHASGWMSGDSFTYRGAKIAGSLFILISSMAYYSFASALFNLAVLLANLLFELIDRWQEKKKKQEP